ncbi:3-oxoacyl-ACP synthase, partial [Simkania negevensis]|nr:3-oxoacyl-ACP synthase [Simkania negevensis]
FVDYEDRETCILFGDGAGAAVISAQGGGFEITSVSIGCDGSGSDLVKLPAGASREPFSLQALDKRRQYIKMNGKAIFKKAVRCMEAAARECLVQANMTQDDISWLIPHQANIRIIEAVANRFDLSMEKVYQTLHKYGNTSASSVVIALEELVKEKDIANGENLLLVAFGGGLTWGASLLKRVAG